MTSKEKSKSYGFTIVELLVVIVVIGILAAITIVSYTGISQKATVASLQSDLNNSSKLLKLYYTEYGYYPVLDSNNCPTSPVNNNSCLKPSGNNSLNNYSSGPDSFYIMAKNGTICYEITNNTSLYLNLNCEPSIVIGNQTWKSTNLNDGNMVNGSTTLNSTQKWCYGNSEANCNSYGALYNWNAIITPRNNGTDICGFGYHVPTNSQWSTLTSYLGDATAGDQIKTTGTSGFKGKPGGYSSGNTFNVLGLWGYFWSSTEYDSSLAWGRILYEPTFGPNWGLGKTYGFSVRCLKN